MEHLLKILVAIIVGWIGYKWWQHKRYRTEADKFKELLIADIHNYESHETTLSAVVLSHFPQHHEAFNKFLIYVPKNKQHNLIKQWQKYQEIYAFFNSAGVFGVVMAELPDPDFEPNQDNVDAVSRKRKKQISSIMRSFIEKL